MTFDAKVWRTFPQQNNFNWNWPNKGFIKHKKECFNVSSLPNKCILLWFSTHVIGSSLAEIVKIKNTRISN